MKKSSYYKYTEVKPMKIKTEKEKKDTHFQMLMRLEREWLEYVRPSD